MNKSTTRRAASALQAQDFRVQYDSITRLLVLPKSKTPHTVVVISVDPPIRKGQTFYQHLLAQFNNDDDTTLNLDITEEQLVAKNKDVSACSACMPIARISCASISGRSGAPLQMPLKAT